MRFSSVDALLKHPPRRSLPSNLSQLGIGRRANKKPRSIAGRAAADRTPSSSVCAFAVELGPHHGTRIRYPCSATNTKNDSAASRRPRHFHDKHFLFRRQIKGISTWRRSYPFSTMIRSMDIRNPTPATISPKSNIILGAKRCRRRRRSISSQAPCSAACRV
jgi:hypothetical protein